MGGWVGGWVVDAGPSGVDWIGVERAGWLVEDGGDV